MKTAYEKLVISRDQARLNSLDLIKTLIPDFFELKGDRLYSDDEAIHAGIGTLKGMPITIISHVRGKNLDEQLKYNYGMPHPEGYRKAQRLTKQAEKFNRPILFIVDTPGAYPGIEAEQRGQASAIAHSLKQLATIEVPTLAIILSNGGSGGALAFALTDQVWMYENAFYSILSPEGFASILYKDASLAPKVTDLMKSTAQDLLGFNIIDKILKEPKKGLRHKKELKHLDTQIFDFFTKQKIINKKDLVNQRYEKYRKMGV